MQRLFLTGCLGALRLRVQRGSGFDDAGLDGAGMRSLEQESGSHQ